MHFDGMKKDIVLVLNYAPVPGKGNDRIGTIIDLLLQDGHEVELITSDFWHNQKKPKEVDPEMLRALPYRYTMLHEPSYSKNVSLKRFYAHKVLARNIAGYLAQRKKPDVVFAVTTSTAVAYVAARYARKNRIPFVIDVQDLWPEAFKMVIKPAKLADLIFAGETAKANYIYQTADAVVGVSQEYVDRALSVNKKVQQGVAVYLGTSLSRFDSLARLPFDKKPDSEFWVVYIGTLGTSYNINVISDAFTILKERGLTDIKFKVLGNGPLMEQFQNYAAAKGIEVEFLGRLAYEEMVPYLVHCDVAVNPLIDTAPQSIINKVADYAAAGLPVVSTLRCQEYRHLLDRYNAGINCSNKNVAGIADAIEKLYRNPELRVEMGRNSRKAAEELFDRDKTYCEIAKMIIGKTKCQ